MPTISLRARVIFVMCFGLAGGLTAVLDDVARDAAPTLRDAREGFETRSVPTKYSADPPLEAPPAESPWQLVRYQSPVGTLGAFLTKDPGDGRRHPAVVWAHGGFGGIDTSILAHGSEDNDQSVATFQEAGLVVMVPSWRGENDNPGRFEMFLGEVDDALGAVEYVAALPWVDPNRIFFAGHSSGGTLALLVALSSNSLRAVFSIGGVADMEVAVREWNGFGVAPFPKDDPSEVRARNPIAFTASLRTPTYAFEGWRSEVAATQREMEKKAISAGVPFTSFSVPGSDHFDVLAPMQRLLVNLMKRDTGAKWSVRVTKADVAAALQPPPGADWTGACDRGSAEDCSRAGRLALGGQQSDAEVERALPHFDAGCRLGSERACGMASSLRAAYGIGEGAPAK